VRVVGYEIKKIWNLRMLGAALLFCALLYLFLGVGDTLDGIRNPGGAQSHRAHYYLEDAPHDLRHMLSQEYLDLQRQFYVYSIESADLHVFAEEMRVKFLAEANSFIAQTPIFTKYGIYSVTGVQDIWAQADEAGAGAESQTALSRVLFGRQSGYIGQLLGKVSVLELNLRDFGEARTREIQASNLERANQRELSERQRQRLTEILEDREYEGLLHGCVFWGMTDLFRQITLILIAAALILHSPLVTTDRMRNIKHLQFHTQTGRRVVSRQLGATLISAALFTTLVLAGFAAYLAGAGVFSYLGEGITSHLTHFGPWSIAAGFTPITFGSYILVLALLCYGFSLGAAALAFMLSRLSRTMISLAIKILPVFMALAVLHDLLLPNRWDWAMIDRLTAPLTLWNHLYVQTGFAYLDVIFIAVFALISILAAAIMARREKRLELL